MSPTGETSEQDPLKLIKEMQTQIQEMQRRHEAEMGALRDENATMRQE